MKRYSVVEVLHNLGVNANQPCDEFLETPIMHAIRLDNPYMIKILKELSERDRKAAEFFHKNYLRFKQKKLYLNILSSVTFLQKLFRKGFFVSKKRRQAENNEDDEMSSVQSQLV